MNRSSGVLMPLSSLPSPYGIGTMGAEAYKFIDFLSAAGQRWWQLLPLGPASCGDSPYSSLSTFAGNPYYIDLELLIADGLIDRQDAEAVNWGSNPEEVDYNTIYESRFLLLRKAFARGREPLKKEIDAFREKNAGWLDNYALFMSLKAHFNMASWIEWPDRDIRMRRPEALKKYRIELKEDIEFWIFTQYLFFSQWDKLRSYAGEKDIGFIGDVPIYVAYDSADVWSEPEFFQLDEENIPKEVSGVPPDDFTDEGQLWGNPLYDWDKMKADGFGWWIRRMEGASRLYDVVRIDHFRGFANYWAVPYGDETARNGKWRQGPGMDLVRVLINWFNELGYIAEDLGLLTPEVTQLLADSGLPGMNVLHFAFDSKADSSYMPHNIKINSTCYVGTHDNNTTVGWVESLSDEDREFCKEYIHKADDESWCRALIRTGAASPAKLFVMTMQDLLELPVDARMNIPGVPLGNWRWRMLPDACTEELAQELNNLTKLYRRDKK